MERAIQKAIKTGWKPKHWMYKSGIKTETIFEKTHLVIKDGVTTHHLSYSEIREDPLFWQALGKAEGWGEDGYCPNICKREHWLRYWHNFINHLAEGKDVDSFFKDLLKE